MTGLRTEGTEVSSLDATWLVNIRKLYEEQRAESKRKYARGEYDAETCNLILNSWTEIFSKVVANRFSIPLLEGYDMLTSVGV